MKLNDKYSTNLIDFFLIYITGYLIIMSSILSIQNPYSTKSPKYALFIFVFIGYCFYYVLSDTDSFIQRGSTKNFLITSAIVIILLRLIWIIPVPTLPYSDFESYNNFAIYIAKQFPAHLLFINYNERGFGYCFLLGMIYKLFGINLFIAKLLNVFLSALTEFFFI